PSRRFKRVVETIQDQLLSSNDQPGIQPQISGKSHFLLTPRTPPRHPSAATSTAHLGLDQLGTQLLAHSISTCMPPATCHGVHANMYSTAVLASIRGDVYGHSAAVIHPPQTAQVSLSAGLSRKLYAGGQANGCLQT
ncbi:hypothetical protein ATANTOWER_005370, partial [Ataeniobius toweri]|nr:hypothetical protein [Ataeniobius toweri]